MNTQKLNIQDTTTPTIVEQAKTKKQNNAQSTNGVMVGAVAGAATGAAAVGTVWAGKEIYDAHTSHEAETPIVDTIDAIADLTANATIVTPEPIVAAEQPSPAVTAEPVVTMETINPDEAADAILADELIDTTDTDIVDPLAAGTIGDIAQVYNINGELETQATVTFEDGSELVMVDVNGDHQFDYMTTANGALSSEMAGLSVSDLEMMQQQETSGGTPGYIASTENDLPVNEDFQGDIIDPTTIA